MSTKSQPAIISSNEIKSRIILEHGELLKWGIKHNLDKFAVSRVIHRRPKYVFLNSEMARAIKALETDFGITPEQLGIQVLEVER